MNRRHFLQVSSTIALSNLMFRCDHLPHERETGLYYKLIQLNDARVSTLLNRQEDDPNHRWSGGIKNRYGIHTAGAAAHFITALMCAYSAPESRYHLADEILNRMERAAKYLLATQHQDGTIDLYSTNFHSTPDTGFVTELVCRAYVVLQRHGSPALARLLTLIGDFISRAGDALSVGGIHTPNHRWVVSMALAQINAIFPKQKFVARIDEWLAEKIDIDPDGQFTEQSASIYSPLTDRCLLSIARLLDRPELYEPVRTNLNMTMYYIHPNGEVVTTASRRQDQYRRGSMAPYYYPYRYMALLDDNSEFAAMARWIERTSTAKLVSQLIYFFEDQSLNSPMPKSGILPDDYVKEFLHSNLVRIRRKDVSATILAQNTTCFTFQKQNAALEAVRFASAFFGKGQFSGESIEVANGRYILRQHLEGPYYQPYPRAELPDDGDWGKMPRSKRPQSEVQLQESVLTVSEQNGVFALKIDIHGTDQVPVAVEFAFRHGGTLSGVRKLRHIRHAYLLENGYGEYKADGQTIRFGPGTAEHSWTQLRGAAPKLDAQSVYVTGFTPFSMTFTIS